MSYPPASCFPGNFYPLGGDDCVYSFTKIRDLVLKEDQYGTRYFAAEWEVTAVNFLLKWYDMPVKVQRKMSEISGMWSWFVYEMSGTYLEDFPVENFGEIVNPDDEADVIPMDVTTLGVTSISTLAETDHSGLADMVVAAPTYRRFWISIERTTDLNLRF